MIKTTIAIIMTATIIISIRLGPLDSAGATSDSLSLLIISFASPEFSYSSDSGYSSLIIVGFCIFPSSSSISVGFSSKGSITSVSSTNGSSVSSVSSGSSGSSSSSGSCYASHIASGSSQILYEVMYSSELGSSFELNHISSQGMHTAD